VLHERSFGQDHDVKLKDDDKLRAIAKATFTLVERIGFSGLTMAAIARETGLATGTLYVSFKSKGSAFANAIAGLTRKPVP
jgi:AcrR family transcriptional regulator